MCCWLKVTCVALARMPENARSVNGADICQFSMVVENCALLGYAANPEEPSCHLLCSGSLKSSMIFVYWQSDLKDPCSSVTADIQLYLQNVHILQLF